MSESTPVVRAAAPAGEAALRQSLDPSPQRSSRILTELGHEPENTDLLEYYWGRAGQPWRPTILS